MVSKITGMDTGFERANRLVLRQIKGKNLFNFADLFGGAGTVIEKDGLKATINDNGTVTIVGTNTSSDWCNILTIKDDLDDSRWIFPAGTYTVPNKLTINGKSPDSSWTSLFKNKKGTITVDEPFWINNAFIAYAAGEVVNETIPLAMVSGMSLPSSGFAFEGETYTAVFTNKIGDGEFNWQTGELKDADGNLIETIAPPFEEFPVLDGANTFMTGVGVSTITYKVPDDGSEEKAAKTNLPSITVEGSMVQVEPLAGTKVDVTSIKWPSMSSSKETKVYVTGENMLDLVTIFGGAGTVIEKDGLTATINEDGTVHIVGTNTASKWNEILAATLTEKRVFPAGSYAAPSGMNLTVVSTVGNRNYGNKQIINVGEPWWPAKAYIAFAPGATVDKIIPLALVSGNVPATSGIPFVGHEYTIQHNGVYGGEVDCTGGTAWATHDVYNFGGSNDGTLLDGWYSPTGAKTEGVLGLYSRTKPHKATNFDPITIELVDGVNHIWTSNDAVRVKYHPTMDVYNAHMVKQSHAVDAHGYKIPVLRVTGGMFGMTKDNANPMFFRWFNMEGGITNRTGTMKWQGSSSVARGNEVGGKYNFTFKFDEALDLGWGEQTKYCAKANVIDFSHSRNVVGAKLWGQICATLDEEDELLASSPNHGAVDGFPFVLYINDEFYGIYTMNIPKDAWMAGMGNGEEECLLCAGNACPANYFKAEATLTTDLEIEYITDESNTGWAKTSVNTLINACINSDGSDLDTSIASMFNWKRAIAFYCFNALMRGDDNVGKNYLLFKRDGGKWNIGHYDMDSTYGLYWAGTHFLTARSGMRFADMKNLHRVMELIYLYKMDELKACYEELRNGIMSEDNVEMEFRNFYGKIPKALLEADNRRWPKLPNTSANNIQQIADWYRIRCAVIDAEVEAM